MQIFELTQPVNEIDWGATAKAVGNRILQAPVRALGQRVGQDLLPPEDDKTIRQQAADIERYFDAAVDMLTHNYDETTVTAQLTNKYGATKNQAMQAIESAFDYIEREKAANPEFAKKMKKGKSKKKSKAALTAPQQPTLAPTPEQIRLAKQRAAAVRADAEAQPVPTAAAPIDPLSQMSPEQQRIMKQKFAGSMARAQMSGSPKPPPTNYGTNVGPAVKPQMTATPTLNVPVTKTNLPAPSNVVPIKPGMMPTPTAQNDILQALTKLGFKPKEAAAAVKQVPPNTSTSDAIRQILSRQPAMSESLTWSRDFDPSATLLKKIKPL
jgi:hypothetical protein